MKKYILKSFVIVAFITFTFEACQKDTETTPSTSTADRDKFLGTWSTRSTGAVFGTLNFTMTISAGNSSPAQVVIKNFDNAGETTSTFAYISGSSISIQPQLVGPDSIQGNGTYNSNATLTFDYIVNANDGVHFGNRSATAHK